MIQLCTIDLDGTLFDNNKNISIENKKAILEAKNNGCRIVIASGRPYNGVRKVLDELELTTEQDYVICYNGAMVFNVKTGTSIFSTTIVGKSVKELYEESKKMGVNFHAFTKEEKLVTDIHNPYTDVEVRINKIEDYIVDFSSFQDEDKFIKCMMVGSDEDITSTLSKLKPSYYDQYSVVRSSKIFLEFLNKATNKGTALEALAKHLGIPMENTMAIGDAGNDLAMIEKAHIGVAMENSFPEIKKVANYITTSNEASGVAKALNHFVNHKD